TDQAMPPAVVHVLRVGRPPPVIENPQFQRVRTVVHTHLDTAHSGTSMFERVGQRLLDYAVRGEFHPRRKPVLLPLEGELHRQPRHAHLTGHLIDLLDPVLSRVPLVVLAKDPEYPAYLRQRRPPGGSDGLQSALRPLRGVVDRIRRTVG